MPEDYRSRFYADYVNTHYQPQQLLDRETYTKTGPFFERNYSLLLPTDRNSFILDIGCGAGQFLYFLRRRGYLNLFGVDTSAPMLELTRQFTELETLWNS